MISHEKRGRKPGIQGTEGWSFGSETLWRHSDKPVRVRRIFSRPGSVKSWAPGFGPPPHLSPPPSHISQVTWPTGHENCTVLHSFHQSCLLFCVKVKIYVQDWHHQRVKREDSFSLHIGNLTANFSRQFCFKVNFRVKLHQIIWNKPVISTFS